MIHRCFVKLKLMLMFAETDDMRKHRPQRPAKSGNRVRREKVVVHSGR
jgi:hypothetical protein